VDRNWRVRSAGRESGHRSHLGPAACAACIPLLICVGCYPLPVRFPARTTDSSGKAIDLTFLKSGSTTREEVSKNLTAIDTGASQPDFFWGRLRMSKYRQIVMVGYVPIGPGDRMWGTGNLLVSYDQKGFVKDFVVVSDSELLPQLDLLEAAAPPQPDLSSRVSISSVVYWVHEKHEPRREASVQLTLDADSIECFDVKIGRNQLQRILVENGNNLNQLRLKLLLRQAVDFSKTPLHKRINRLDLSVDPPTLLMLHRYVTRIARTAPPAISTDPSHITKGGPESL
jgi:hypothetical protein